MSTRRHIFISHHHADDARLQAMTDMLNRQGYDVRNSSIRANPDNQKRLAKNEIPQKVLERLLRMKISWASCLVVLIGKETHSRPWVNWEIQKAHEQGKRIIGVYDRGGSEADVPSALENYGDAIVKWDTNSIIGAIDGTNTSFEKPDGTSRPPVNVVTHITCN